MVNIMKKGPLNDEIIIAVSRLVDDAQQVTREPSHSEIEFQIHRFNLQKGDPKFNGQTVGKAKRVRSVLSWAIENDNESGEKFVASLIALIKTIGGFRNTSPNYVGNEAILNAQVASKGEGYELNNDGELRALVLDNLSELEMEEALNAYIRRAKRGSEDAALLAGTGKDLLEAVAGYIHTKKWGDYPHTANFPTLLGQTFISLGLATSHPDIDATKKTKQRFEISLYELACSINTLRNKEGTGHGRPFLPTITKSEAKVAIESMGVIAEFLMNKLKDKN
jgi:hypothetical protein